MKAIYIHNQQAMKDVAHIHNMFSGIDTFCHVDLCSLLFYGSTCTCT